MRRGLSTDSDTPNPTKRLRREIYEVVNGFMIKHQLRYVDKIFFWEHPDGCIYRCKIFVHVCKVQPGLKPKGIIKLVVEGIEHIGTHMLDGHVLECEPSIVISTNPEVMKPSINFLTFMRSYDFVGELINKIETCHTTALLKQLIPRYWVLPRLSRA